MGDHGDGGSLVVEPFEEAEDGLSVGGVQGSGRLVGQDQGGGVDQCAGDGDALPLAAGQLVRLVCHAVPHADPFQCLAGQRVPAATLLSSLLDEAALLQHVIDDLRDLAAADAGELRLHPEPIDLADLLSQVATAYHGRADGAGARLLTEVGTAEGSPLLATADPLRLRQAVGNLVSNAVRHTPHGGTVTPRARGEAGDADRPRDARTPDSGGSRTVIEVVDTGSGIAAEDLPRVFDRFWRAVKSRSRQHGGSGLGLSIVRKLAEAHGGEVAASSDPGSGSIFTISLPG